jgi:hypothetical protein
MEKEKNEGRERHYFWRKIEHHFARRLPGHFPLVIFIVRRNDNEDHGVVRNGSLRQKQRNFDFLINSVKVLSFCELINLWSPQQEHVYLNNT